MMASNGQFSCVLCVTVICVVLVLPCIEGVKNVTRAENEIPTDITPDQPTTTSTTTAAADQHNAKLNTVIKPTPLPTHSTTRQNENTIDPMDKFLLDGLLNIVEETFGTLNKRLIAVERGINTLQYYNVRNFRVVNTHLHAVDNILHGIHTEIDSVQSEQRSSEQSIQGVRKEVVDLQSLNSGMFQAIEQNLVHFHGDMQSRIAELKEGLDQSNARIDDVKNDTAELQSDVSKIMREQRTILQNTEASVILASENEMVTASLKNITGDILATSQKTELNSKNAHTSLTSLMESVTSVAVVTNTIQSEIESFSSNFTSIPTLPNIPENKNSEEDSRSEFRELKAPSSQYHMTCGKMIQLMDEKLKHINVTLTSNQPQTPKPSCDQDTPSAADFKNQSKKLLRALGTVNENIFQSITLYRHTGSLIERVISDTELIASEQVRLREDLLDFLLNGTINLFNQSYPEIADFTDLNRAPRPSSDTPKDCPNVDKQSEDAVNATQLVDILTNLASTSVLTINSSLSKLDEEFSRLTRLHEDSISASLINKAEAFARDDPKAGANSQIREIQNRTEWIFTLVEAIASNTGWIPYFFHNMRFVEAQANKTLKQLSEINAKTDDILVGQRASMSLLIRPPQFLQPPKQTTPMPTKASPITSVPNLTSKLESKPDKPEVQYSNQSIVVDDRMTFVYETSVKLNRLIPALTNLLGEPEPYIALVNGPSDREGRVEIYHKGKWGTLAQNIGHIEASYICRKLHYLGGISAGRGHYGAGTGAFWNLNVTCLQTRWCDSVSAVADVAEYQHENDAGIICDHMLRLSSTEEDIEPTRHSGKLEIFHENDWRPICFKGWGRRETSIVCKQLGFREGAATALKNESLVDDHWMTGVTCDGSESRLDACQHDFVFNGCPDFRQLSVICS